MPTSYYPHPIIAREGWPFIAGAFALALLVHLFAGWLWALPVWLIALFVLQFFRDPPRVIPVLAGAVLAPADGRIVAVSAKGALMLPAPARFQSYDHQARAGSCE